MDIFSLSPKLFVHLHYLLTLLIPRVPKKVFQPGLATILYGAATLLRYTEPLI